MQSTLHLLQISGPGKRASCALLEAEMIRPAASGISTYDLAMQAIALGKSLSDMVSATDWGAARPLAGLTLLPPVTHPDPTHLHGTGTGLTHLGSARTRSAMHATDATETDSMKMFRWGVEGGKPQGEAPGVQPEWFYKGNGHWAAAPGGDLVSPGFALDGGEEPELAGIYLIGPDGAPWRLGFALANEFSDHVTERQNYLLLAHSKLRSFSFGPALRVGPPPADIQGSSRILRDGREIWSKPFLTGEANMSHTIANLEHHHFKYDIFRQPGDLHVHMFGTATLSFADKITCLPGDVFEISAPDFGPPLRNSLRVDPAPATARRLEVRML